MEDLQWALENKEKEDSPSKSLKKNSKYSLSNGSPSTPPPSLRRLMGSPREITRGKSPAKRGAQCSSTPMDVPHWSKTYGKKGEEVDDYTEDCQNDAVDGTEDDDGEEMIPPHEYIARRLSRAKISSFSMCEGNGRTLKGRDLRRVRDDVLTKTGYLE